MDSPAIAAAGAEKLVKGKSKLQDSDKEKEEDEVGYKECRMLHIEILNTEGIDRDTMKNPTSDSFKSDTRVYRVLAEVGPGVGFSTPREQGLPDPNWSSWKIINTLPLDIECKYLYVEVLKLWSKQDPGTSKGHRVVGRVAIPLPKETNQLICGRYGLVGLGMTGDIGHIIVAMKITKVLMVHDVGDVDDPDDDDDDDEDESFDEDDDDQ